jgi:hypothetical protein
MERPESEKASPGFWKPGAVAPEGLCGIGTGQFDRETEKEDLVRIQLLPICHSVHCLIFLLNRFSLWCSMRTKSSA